MRDTTFSRPHETAPLDLDRILDATLAGDRRAALRPVTGLWRVTATDRAIRQSAIDSACSLLAARIRAAQLQQRANPLAVLIWVGTRLGPGAASQVRKLSQDDAEPSSPLRLPSLVWYAAGLVATAGNGSLDWWRALDLPVPAQADREQRERIED